MRDNDLPKTSLTYALVLHCNIEDIQKIKEYINGLNGPRIVYQRASADKLYITEEENQNKGNFVKTNLFKQWECDARYEIFKDYFLNERGGFCPERSCDCSSEVDRCEPVFCPRFVIRTHLRKRQPKRRGRAEASSWFGRGGGFLVVCFYY